MKLHGIELAAGMIIFTADGNKYIVAPIEIPGYRFGFFDLNGGWTVSLADSIIIEIKSPLRGKAVDSGITLWKRPYEISKQEIAEKFGIPVEHLRII